MYNSLTGVENRTFDITYVLNMTNWNLAFNLFGMVFGTYTNLRLANS
jgi:hypothetical protein